MRSMDWVPVAGDLISPLSVATHYTSRGAKRDLMPDEVFVVTYSESTDHRTESHNVSVFHADLGLFPLIIRQGMWSILNRKE